MRVVARFCDVDLTLMSGHDPGDLESPTGCTSTSAILDISLIDSKLLFQRLFLKLSDPHHLVADPQELLRYQPK